MKYIFVDENDVIFEVSDTLDYQNNGNYLIKNGTLAVPQSLVKAMYEIEEVPNEVEVQKYCYTEDNGFFKNESYREYVSYEKKIEQLQEQVTNLELALTEMYEMGV